MRQISLQRRRLVVFAGSCAAMSGMGPLLLQHHPKLRVAWMVFVALALVRAIVLMVRLRRSEGCV